MKSTVTFRTLLAVLALVGVGILYVSLHPRHSPSKDDGSSPKLPAAEATPVNR